MRQIDIPKTTELIVSFIKTTVTNAGFSRVVVALSGGVDSSTATALAVKALGRENVHVLLLPYKGWHNEATAHAQLFIKQLGISLTNIHEIDISPTVDMLIKNVILGRNEMTTPESGFWTSQNDKEKIRLGNIMARVRMIVLYDFAKKLSALVLGTENKSEHFLGYYTRFGDEASDIEPIRQLYKTEVFQMAKYLGVPEMIITKAPTAGLWEGQTDETEFGFSYKEADEILYGLLEEKITEEELEKRGINLETVKKVKAWVKKVDFKHHLPLLAPLPKTK